MYWDRGLLVKEERQKMKKSRETYEGTGWATRLRKRGKKREKIRGGLVRVLPRGRLLG